MQSAIDTSGTSVGMCLTKSGAALITFILQLDIITKS